MLIAYSTLEEEPQTSTNAPSPLRLLVNIGGGIMEGRESGYGGIDGGYRGYAIAENNNCTLARLTNIGVLDA